MTRATNLVSGPRNTDNYWMSSIFDRYNDKVMLEMCKSIRALPPRTHEEEYELFTKYFRYQFKNVWPDEKDLTFSGVKFDNGNIGYSNQLLKKLLFDQDVSMLLQGYKDTELLNQQLYKGSFTTTHGSRFYSLESEKYLVMKDRFEDLYFYNSTFSINSYSVVANKNITTSMLKFNNDYNKFIAKNKFVVNNERDMVIEISGPGESINVIKRKIDADGLILDKEQLQTELIQEILSSPYIEYFEYSLLCLLFLVLASLMRMIYFWFQNR